jgi:hypothetical protein
MNGLHKELNERRYAAACEVLESYGYCKSSLSKYKPIEFDELAAMQFAEYARADAIEEGLWNAHAGKLLHKRFIELVT